MRISTNKTLKRSENRLLLSAFMSNDDMLDYRNYLEEGRFDKLASFVAYNDKLVLDSGASEHYTPNKHWLLNYKPVTNKSITVANGTIMPILGVGDIPIKVKTLEILVQKVNYVPGLTQTLISSRELTKKNWSINFNQGGAIISHNRFSGKIKANWDKNAYYLDAEIDYERIEPVLYKVDPTISNKLNLYHERLLHINKDYVYKTIENSLGFSKIPQKLNLEDCEACNSGKLTTITGKKPMSTTTPLTAVDMDIAGPFKIKGLKGERYFLTITDRGSRAI
jgi:hypothetical protein